MPSTAVCWRADGRRRVGACWRRPESVIHLARREAGGWRSTDGSRRGWEGGGGGAIS